MASASYGPNAEQVAASCQTCRKRKVKCDRTPGRCQRCHRFGAECVYQSDSISSHASHVTHPADARTQAGLQRKRAWRSCIQCKRAKAKCSGGTGCVRCTRKALECSYEMDGIPRNLSSLEARSHAVPAWLMTADLPSGEGLNQLVEVYFERIHTVRCLGFLHIPTFMEKLKSSDKIYTEESGLLHVMCALAAPFLYGDICSHGDDVVDRELRFYEAGKGWADTALQYSFRNLGTHKLECLATEVLLHEYYLRTGEYAKALVVSGQIARHLQLLQLNVEYDPEAHRKARLSTPVKESRRRLMWACYLLDAFIECGIDQLRLISAEDIHVQLPCPEDLFIRGTPCVTETLHSREVPPGMHTHFDIPDMRALYIRAIRLRAKILKYVKELEDEVPWESDNRSRFSLLNTELQNLEASIPDALKMTTANKYLYKASGRLNLFFGLHIVLSQTSNDLYRICVSQLVFPDTSTKWIREHAPKSFLERCHRMCLEKAVYIATLLKDLWLCHKPSLIDTLYANHVQICSSVLVTTLLSWGDTAPLLPQFDYKSYRTMLQDNLTILQYLQKYLNVDAYCQSAKEALKRFNQLFPAEAPSQIHRPLKDGMINDQVVTHSQSSLEYILNPLGTYPLARKQTQDQPTFNNTEKGEAIVGEALNMMPEQPVTIGDDNVDSLDESVSPSPFEWGSETLMFDSAGYPTFLDQLTGWGSTNLEWNEWGN
ncbi:transcriptional regulator family: Fungal Specific TF [Penicillium roqueforti]|uniref:Zn(2)-C6 fungal-type DNA-binding domain n=1 Tax=Penicillium roqueforti (strain FM164) TaxID=1365484 RepID=W6QIH5_PENRF|nr:transcriptional regulator family: Fungal Specific TF [Penicillium roqueforti]CDM29382.1 Zn(2)-C6 fungal-type DNA-binding domain [Penicillium roqueforti FM164]KAI2701673.1 transcriptional regulator family: Fungal Specific TF [Penicillium roqueforti]KAI2722104.1 transcriptional regulator family: Fungal Specific TF [Penicillium roqueforti]KAI2741849.1 transcriptional regulator family: Fungal Specific TF [Penicillium roqueforti]